MSNGEEALPPELVAIRRRFLEILPGRVGTMTDALAQIEQVELSRSERMTALQAIREVAHKFAGTAGSLGYPCLAEISRTLEKEMEPVLQDAELTSAKLSGLLPRVKELLLITASMMAEG